ncbi:uncharacterized protein DUF1631 [Luteimonas cucumeris]|uniref:Uncharacterized protein DUF1631 n=1 Tax=Luteimonas cucumeris TaxID=985012 RepID=A0A562L4W1_9GAMM|nr:DUF1631 family protein [Luteimonas cucumeris]TWI02681.1 uncharacterized protein DUF1631 [Luteimonas cucumeris]
MTQPLDKYGSGAFAHASRQAPTFLVESLKRTALDQLGTITRGLLRPTELTLHEIELEAPGTRRADLDAVAMLKQREAALVMRYRQLLADSFDQLLTANVPAQSGATLSLLSEDELDQHLDAQRIATTLRARHARALAGAEARFTTFARMLGVADGKQPIDPERLSELLVKTLQGQTVPDGLRDLLFKQYQAELSHVLDAFYSQIDTQLAAAGYGLHAAATPRRGTAPAAVPSAESFMGEPGWEQVAPRTGSTPYFVGGGAGPGPSAYAGMASRLGNAAAGVHGGEMAGAALPSGPAGVASEQLVRELGLLREQLHQWRHQAGMSGPAVLPSTLGKDALPGAQRRPLRTDELRSVASLLQGEDTSQFADALAHGGGRLQSALRNEMLEGARKLGLDPRYTSLSAEEQDAIDLVGLLFEAICDVHRLWEEGRGLLGRLVLPYLKLALHDDSLFVQPTHPARRLLDVLTEACESNRGASPHDRELLDRAQQAVERIISEYQEDLSVFELAASELNELVVQQRHRIELAERRAAEAAFGRERLMQARQDAAQALAQCVREYKLTAPVRQFLSEHWQHHVVQTLLRDGVDSARHIGAMNLGQALVEIDIAAGSAQGAVIADRLLLLMPLLRDCLGSSGLDASAADEAIARLVRALAWPDVPRSVVTPVPVPALETVETEPALRLIDNSGKQQVNQDALAAMRRLSLGDWVRLIDDEGFERALKIAWISPLTSRFLIVNRRGVRELVATAEQLALLAQAGRLIVGLPDAPFEGAMKQVWKHLQRAA